MLTYKLVSSTVIEEISRHCSTNTLAVFAYFYFEFHSKDVHPETVLRSLIIQLSSQCPRTPDVLEKLFSEKGEGRRTPTLEELTSTLKSIIETLEHAYIVFDAHDECQDRRDFLKLLKEIHGWKLGTIHLLATSRQEHDIGRALRILVSHGIPMDDNLVDDDIRLHVSKTLGYDDEFEMYSAEQKKMVENSLAEGAHGM